jgi:hypothetical protein
MENAAGVRWVAQASRLFRRSSRPSVHGRMISRLVNATRPVDDSAGRRAEQAGRLCYVR